MQRNILKERAYDMSSINKKQTIKVKVDQTKLPNKMHFEVQKTTRAQIYKAKKGKGSYQRRSKYVKDI